MLKLTIVGRINDGLPLAQGPRYTNEEENNDDGISGRKQQAEFLLQEVSRRALPPSKMTIFLDHHCFNYIVKNGICFMALFESMYPKKLVFCYLQDLYKEFVKFHDVRLTHRIMRPYSFVKFDGVIGNVRRKYVDTRSQANLSKINSDASQDLEIMSENFSRVAQRRRRLELFERISGAHLHASPIWCSKRLESNFAKQMGEAAYVLFAFILNNGMALMRVRALVACHSRATEFLASLLDVNSCMIVLAEIECTLKFLLFSCYHN